jgi:hypothetical protein
VKLTVVPTDHCRVEAGLSITGLGGVLPPTLTVIGALVEEAPRASVTLSLTE